MTYLLALDQGTSSSRTIVFRDSGEIVGSIGPSDSAFQASVQPE